MLVIFGANGQTGFEILCEAIRRKIPTRAIARNSHDTFRLEKVLDVNELFFADANHVQSIKAVLQDATSVVCCIDARTAGFGAPKYAPEATANIVQTASEMGIQNILHLSVMGAYRWSPNPLNKDSFHSDIHVRRLRVPWTMLRVSCYHDELINGHVTPPDEGKPHPIRSSSRYSPVSRKDTARVVCNILPDLIPNRTWLLGGPKTYDGISLKKTIEPYRKDSGKRKTKYGPLPHGDFSVATETSEVMVGWVPTESLEWTLAPKKNPITPPPFWNRAPIDFHTSDQQTQTGIIKNLPLKLRYVLHKKLFDDLSRIAIDAAPDIQFNFSQSSWNTEYPEQLIYQFPFQALRNIQIIQNNACIYQGDCQCIFDELSDSFILWWGKTKKIPQDIWNSIDLGTKRRMSQSTFWKDDPLVHNFTIQSHEKVQI